jgi:aspartate/methionine/tyrosine aminotransferase
MSITFSEKISSIKPSATLAINSLVQKKIAAGEKVHNFGIGEPIIRTSEKIIEAAEFAMKNGKTLYPPVAGIFELREAASDWMNRLYGSNFQVSETVVTCGGKFGLFATLFALLSPGDEVLIGAPFWVSYPQIVNMFSGTPKIIPTEKNIWKITPEEIEKNCSQKTKILILNNAGNPTGVLYTLEEIKNILSVAEKNNLLVISDEVYSGLTFDNNKFISCASFPEWKNRVVVIQSCSKHFAMTGWRVGFVFGPKEIIDRVIIVQGQSTTGTSSISQWAALAALENSETIMLEIKNEMQKRRDVFIEGFEKYLAVSLDYPKSGLYSFFPLDALGVSEQNDEKFCLEILEKGNIAFVPGSAFGIPGYIRASFGGLVEDIERALVALEKYLRE